MRMLVWRDIVMSDVSLYHVDVPQQLRRSLDRVKLPLYRYV